jgi:hypothetical protein
VTTEDWAKLEDLCRRALEVIPLTKQKHEIADAVRLTGAFAASVQKHS